MSDRPFDQTAADSGASTKDVAGDQAKQVAANAQDDARQVAGTAKGEAQALADEARGHAQTLIHQVRSEAGSQLGMQQLRLADGLRAISTELDQMATGADSGTASGLVSQAAGQVEGVARWLESREPADVVDEVRRYARRNPGTFLAGAALLGLVGGRLTRGLQADAQRRDDEQDRLERGIYRTYPETYAGQAGTVDHGTYAVGERAAYVPVATDPAQPQTTEVFDQSTTPTGDTLR